MQSWVVPANGQLRRPSSPAGLGGHTTATIAVTPGETIQINVGCVGSDSHGNSVAPGGFGGSPGGETPNADGGGGGTQSANGAGGGGGSGFALASATSVTHDVGVRSGDGKVVVTFTPVVPPAPVPTPKPAPAPAVAARPAFTG